MPHRFTRHTYVGTERAPDRNGNGAGWAHMFRCEDTGKVRRWGYEA